MKAKSYLTLGLFLFCSMFVYSQCTVTAKGDTTIVCGGVAQLDIDTTGGTPDVISWSPSTGLSSTSIAEPIASPPTTTQYTVTITTGACTAVDSVLVTVTPLTADAGSDKTLTCGGSTQLDSVKSNYTGNGSLTYSWSPATGLSSATIINPVVTIKQSTKYYVTVTTPNGCTAMDSVMVVVNPLMANAGSDKMLSCGNTIQLDQVTSNYTGTGTLTYGWSPVTGLSAANIPNPTTTIKETTKYAVTVTTPDGCVAVDSMTVFVGPLSVDAGADKMIVCGGETGLGITTNYTGSGSLIYAWTPLTGLVQANTANPVARPLQTTQYFVNITTPNGCTARDSITVIVNPLTANAGPDKTLTCGGSTQLQVVTNYTGSGSPTYAWAPATGLSASNIPNPIASVIQNTILVVTVSTFNGCVAKDTVNVKVDPLIANAGQDITLICGGADQLSASSNYTGSSNLTYTWTPAAGLNLSNIPNPIVNVIQPTTFTVTIKTLNGCTATDTVRVNVSPLLATTGPDITMICGRKEQLEVKTNYTGTSNLTYTWAPASGLNLSNIVNPIVSVTQTTTFTVTVKTLNNCRAYDTITVFVNPLTVNAGSDKTHICGGSVQLDSALTNYTGTEALTYIWLPKAGLNNASIPNPVSNSPGVTYTLTITTPFGACKATDQVKVSIDPLSAPEICMATVDTTAKNVITWIKNETPLLDSFLIYRETTVPGTYVKIGSLPKTAPTVFKDINSKPDMNSNRYKVSVKDTCGVESLLSLPHKTIYLSIKQGAGLTWDLNWENYEGATVSSYILYRGTSAKNLQFLDATPGTVTQYTDSNPPPGDVFYQLEITRPTPCSVTNPVNTSRSNIAASNKVGIDEINKVQFSVYPNPATEQITINLKSGAVSNMTLNVYNAIGALVKTCSVNQNVLQLNVSDLSSGFYTMELRANNSSSKQKLLIQK